MWQLAINFFRSGRSLKYNADILLSTLTTSLPSSGKGNIQEQLSNQPKLTTMESNDKWAMYIPKIRK